MRNLVRSVCCAAVLASPAAMAGVTGNVGAVSNYMFRGIEQSLGSAFQGGADWSHASGAYAGAWISNTEFADANGNLVSYETDLYGGYLFKAGPVTLDPGLIYYYYRDQTDFNTLEVYLGATYDVYSAKVFYTPEYLGAVDAAGDDVGGLYLTASAALPLSKTLTFTPQVGLSTGDGPKAIFGDDYVDYSFTLAKALDNGLTASFALVGTNIDNATFGKDDQKLVVGLKKTFDL